MLRKGYCTYTKSVGIHEIIYRDIKSQNILLDEMFCAKIFDFGIAKIMRSKESKVVSNLQGTPRYMALDLREDKEQREGPLDMKLLYLTSSRNPKLCKTARIIASFSDHGVDFKTCYIIDKLNGTNYQVRKHQMELHIK